MQTLKSGGLSSSTESTLAYNSSFLSSNSLVQNASPFLSDSKAVSALQMDKEQKLLNPKFLSTSTTRVQTNNNGDIQSTELPIERFEMHEIRSYEEATGNWRFKQKVLLPEKYQLIVKIQNCYFEPGLWTEADEYFENLCKSYGSMIIPLSILSDITNHNLQNEHTLEGVLHILSNYSYEEIDPFGITIAISCAVNHSMVIQDLLITCFDSWESFEAIDVLQGIELDEPWLKTYQADVINHLLERQQGA